MKLEYSWQLVLVLAGALASAYFGYWFGKQPENIFFIEYEKVSEENIIKRLEGPKEIKVKIKYKNKELSELSGVKYSLINRSKIDFGKFKIYFEVEKDNNIPLFHTINLPTNYPKKAITLLSNKNGLYVFEIEYMNRSMRELEFMFYFSGGKPPEMTVKTGSKGVSIMKRKFIKTPIILILYKVFLELWWGVAIILAYIFISFRYDKSFTKLRNKDFQDSIRVFIKNTESLSEEDRIQKIIEARHKKPKFIRVLSSIFNKI